jgi:predicted nuclease of predicted toxin-antitoxin system
MKILLDECVPKAIKHSLSVAGHECSTVPEAGFAGRSNGELLSLAESTFEAFVTLDKGMQFQQKLAECNIGIVLIRARSSRVADILPHIPACLAALRSIKPGEVIQIGERQQG